MLQCVAVCCDSYLFVLCKKEHCCNTLQHAATYCNTLQHTSMHCILKIVELSCDDRKKSFSEHSQKTALHECVAVCCSVLQRVAVCCSVLQCVALSEDSSI